jgi:recombination protein RecR
MALSPLIERLIEALRGLPGVGPKSAQRMAFFLLEGDREVARRIVRTLTEAMERVGRCDACQTLSETPLCPICANPRRQGSVLCVVETPADVEAFERTAAFNGKYFVLHGRLSPLDGVGPRELGLDRLSARLGEGDIEELIVATNLTVEGEATAHYLGELAREARVRASRIAHGVPLGGELEYIDGETLSHALTGRRDL